MPGYHDLSFLRPAVRDVLLPYLIERPMETAVEESLTIAELIRESYNTAKEKGWWDDDLKPEDMGFGVKLMLMVSELSEALEEYRSGRGITEIWYRDDGKPEGIPAELADVIIRICDLCGHDNIPLDRALREKLAFNKTRPHRHGGKRA